MTRDQAIEKITRRLIEYYQPERIYLFGSSARGDYGPDSDLDFMVLLPDNAPEEMLKAGARPKMHGIPFPAEIVRWKLSEFDRRLHLRASFPSTIVREGRLLYERSAVAV